MPTISQKKKARKLFNARVKAIRPFIDFDYDLRKSPSKVQKAKVKRYSDEIAKLTNRPYQVYRPRQRSRLRPAQQFSQHETALPGIRVAFVPTDGKGKTRLRFTKKGIVARSEHIAIRGINLSISGLAGDTPGYVARRISGGDASHFTIQAGAFEIPIPYLPESVPAAVSRLVERYGGGGEVPDREDRENHHWANWLHGLKGYRSDGEQGDIVQYLSDKRDRIKHDKKERDKLRKRIQRESSASVKREAARPKARQPKRKSKTH